MRKIKTTKINVIDRIIIIFVPIFLGIIIGLIADYLLKNLNYIKQLLMFGGFY